jgi:hypothetical protein
VNDAEAEAFYVAARILEEVAKNGGNDEDATVCARVAERVADGHDATESVDYVADDAGRTEATERLRLAFEEVRQSGEAGIVENIDEAVVANFRSELDG